MMRWFRRFLWMLPTSMVFMSCTCQRDVPEPPQVGERKSGFQALATPQPRKVEVIQQLAKVTPIQPTVPEVQETPEPGPEGLPADFPSDIPLPEDAETFAVQELAQGAKNVLFRVDAEAPEVFGFYKDNMREEGWNVTQEYQHKYQSFLSFKKDKMITNMTVSKDPKTGKQVVAIMYYIEEDLPFPEF